MAYGLRPVKGLSGGVQTGGSNEYPLVDGETDDIFEGHIAHEPLHDDRRRP
jgi:hypothetical protein